MALVDKIRMLANQQDMSIPDLELKLGMGNGTISRWRTGSPNTDKLRKVADYFHVSLDYLLERDVDSLNRRDKRDIARDLDRIMSEIESDTDGPLFYNGVPLKEDDMAFLSKAIEVALTDAKMKNKETYNPNKNKK
mgnify:FL=1